MYLYLYAPFLRNKKYARELALLEGRVTDFGLEGKIAQLSQFLKFNSAVKEFGAKRLTTVVLVGDDALLEEAVHHFALSNIVLGYIPLVESVYAPALGIPSGAPAVDILAARRLVRCDVGRVGEQIFLGTLRIAGQGVELHAPTFSVFPKGPAVFEVVNLAPGADPADGLLEVRVTPLEGQWFKKPGAPTVFKLASCRFKSVKPLAVQCGTHILKTPFQVDILPKAVRIVGGRGVRMKNAPV